MAVTAWETVPLEELLDRRVDGVDLADDVEYRQVTVRIRGRGIALRAVAPGSKIGTKRQYEIHTGQLLVSKIDARNGAFAIVPSELDGAIVTQDFPAFDIQRDRCLPEFMELLTTRPEFWEECLLASKGSTNRVRLNIDEFLRLEADLPSIDEQRRIVRAVTTVDEVITALRAEAAAATSLRASLREELITNSDAEPVALSEVILGIDAGKSPKCEERPPNYEEWGVLKLSAIRPAHFRADEAKVLAPGIDFPDRARVRVGDVLTNRASGSLRLVGSVCLVEDDPGRRLLSDKTLRLRFDQDRVHDRYAVEAIATRPVRDQIEQEASGSSGQKNISQSDIGAFEIPLPPNDVQVSIADRLFALRDVAHGAEAEASALAAVRESLVDALLSGDRRVGAPDWELVTT